MPKAKLKNLDPKEQEKQMLRTKRINLLKHKGDWVVCLGCLFELSVRIVCLACLVWVICLGAQSTYSGYQNKWNIHRIGKSAVADWISMTQK